MFVIIFFIVLSFFLTLVVYPERFGIGEKPKYHIGESVTYKPTGEKGIVKNVKGNYAYVVYSCDDNWKNYTLYTGIMTSIHDLKHGWT